MSEKVIVELNRSVLRVMRLLHVPIKRNVLELLLQKHLGLSILVKNRFLRRIGVVLQGDTIVLGMRMTMQQIALAETEKRHDSSKLVDIDDVIWGVKVETDDDESPGEDLAHLLDMANESSVLDGEVGKRLNQMVPVHHIPRLMEKYLLLMKRYQIMKDS